ncbi:MAG TPA: Sjogren's syndrome/scleroderma autoantigen 1 family protein [Nitrosarchaeum sp.]|nr:Sjogren's syndrome/scleroderma autoantigen 1 family protein [Nitrosarchaeum sp.]
MSKELTKKAVDMLLSGATLLSEPCPYCSGVRVMKEGHALCVKCGREPEKKEIPIKDEPQITKSGLEITLEKKLSDLSKELEQETSHEKQQEILRSINSIIETIKKLEKH